jgi:FtsP/CotA-like multicopper oxidase with cupredoxin domain
MYKKKIFLLLTIIIILVTTLISYKPISKNIDSVLEYPFKMNGQVTKNIDVAGKSYPVRHFSITAISLSIAYNKFGDHDPNGKMYVLNENKDMVLKFAKENPTIPYELIEPLVIRANAGEVVVVDFYNELPSPASIHITGVETNVQKSDGAIVGKNRDTTTKNHIRYVWYAKNEGTNLFHDMTDMRSTEDAKNIHGLFGVLAVEKAGSTWTSPKTGAPLLSGAHADIHHPMEPDFREFATIFHDEPEMKDINGKAPLNHETHMPQATMPINYRAEPMRNRMVKDPGEEKSMSSWVHGDPSTEIMQTYKGDPVKIRLVHAGVKETHVFHIHNQQWMSEPNDPDSNIIDSVSFSPQEEKDINLLFGAGSLTETIGDIIWHCHLYPHFNEGMWGMLRVNDRLDVGGRILPDGSKTNPLKSLPDRVALPIPDALHPGYPLFLKGEFGMQAKKPPFGIIGSQARIPTALEKANFVAGQRGNLYAKPAPANAPLKIFKIVAIQLPLVYNSQGWNDPQGRIFVLKEDEADVLAGRKKPEPLVLRANAGDKIEVHLTNKLPRTIKGSAFQIVTETTEAGFHIHLVKFDTISADGGANGYNYSASALYGDTLVETFYANSELRNVFFHDHLAANAHQQHGLFGAVIIEPAGSTYHDPKTGKVLKSGTQAIIKVPGLPDFREFFLAVHDFAFLFDKNGKPLNPPNIPGSADDPGVMGINYKSEPLKYRKGDPAYAFSSFVHGDPVTPIMEAYAGDPVRIRLLDGAHEEQHSFNMKGLRWHSEPANKLSPLVSQQTLGISEAFNFHLDEKYKAGDYLYYFGGEDDLWLGLWGIFRAHEKIVSNLLPLDDRTIMISQNKPLLKKDKVPPKVAFLPDLPKGATMRKFEISAIQKDLKYNKYGDHDPNGLLYVYKDEESGVLSGKITPEPLVIRANAGDIIEVTLTNHLTKPLKQTFHPNVPVNSNYPPSNRVSINSSLTLYDPLNSGGATVGYNPDQTVGPGESITYRWYADQELGTTMLSDMGDIMNHRGHGLWGALVIEPKGAVYLNPKTMKPLGNKNTRDAIIKVDNKQFHEFVLFMQDGIDLYDKAGKPIPDAVDEAHGAAATVDNMGGAMPGAVKDNQNKAKPTSKQTNGSTTTKVGANGLIQNKEAKDYEDQGQKGFNYKSENFKNRFIKNSDPLQIFSSRIHRDPSTPVLEANAGDDVRIRLLMPSDKPRNHSFVLHGHTWKSQPNDPNSPQVWSQGAISVGSVYDINFTASSYAGDYVYRSGAFKWSVEQGMWGIFRVHGNEQNIIIGKIILMTIIVSCVLLLLFKRNLTRDILTKIKAKNK